MPNFSLIDPACDYTMFTITVLLEIVVSHEIIAALYCCLLFFFVVFNYHGNIYILLLLFIVVVFNWHGNIYILL